MNKRLLAVPALGVLLAFGAVACGDDNSKQLESWATNVCGAAKDPIAQAQAALADTGQVKTGETPADLKKRLSTDIGRLAKTNQDIGAAIDAAGAPKVTDGANLQKDAVAELKKASDGYLDVQKKLDALATDDQSKFSDGLRGISDQLQQLASLSTEAQSKLQRGDLGAAMAKQEGCKPAPAGSSATPSAGASGGASGAPATPSAGAAAGTPAPRGTPAPSGTPAPGATGSAAPAAAPTPSATAPATPAPSAS